MTSRNITEHGDEASEKISISSYAGITESTRIRKPPGGDTNDIFGMENRQRLQTNAQKFRENELLIKAQTSKRNFDILNDQEEKCTKDSADFSDLLNQLNASKPFGTPSYTLDKENLNFLSDEIDPMYSKLTNKLSENNLKDIYEDAEKETKSFSKKYLRRNPITGEVIEVQVTVRPKLADCSNFVAPTPDCAQTTKGLEAHRTSVRVRQPPGGTSSNIF